MIRHLKPHSLWRMVGCLCCLHLLAACSASDDATTGSSHPISIDLAVDAPSSRATLYNSGTELQGKEQIDIRMYSGSSDYYYIAADKSRVTPNDDKPYLDWKSSSWAFFKSDGTNNVYFWPDTFTGSNIESPVSFVAFAPRGTITNVENEALSSAGASFDVTAIPLSDDIMVGSAANQTYSTANPVRMTMHHVCSAVDFVVVLSPRMTITKLTISGIAKSGSYAGNGTTNTWSSNTGTEGTIVETTFADKNGDGTPGQMPGDLNYGASISDNAPYIVVPQTLTTNATITLEATVSGEQKTYTFNMLTADPNHGSTTAVTSWEPGKKYTYQLCVNADDPEFGLVSVIVTQWDKQGSSSTDVE